MKRLSSDKLLKTKKNEIVFLGENAVMNAFFRIMKVVWFFSREVVGGWQRLGFLNLVTELNIVEASNSY